MNTPFSPTGYYAHYKVTYTKPDANHWSGHAITDRWVDTYPVIGYADVALVIDEGGIVKRVTDFLDEKKAEDGAPEGETYHVYMEVNTDGGGSEGGE